MKVPFVDDIMMITVKQVNNLGVLKTVTEYLVTIFRGKLRAQQKQKLLLYFENTTKQLHATPTFQT